MGLRVPNFRTTATTLTVLALCRAGEGSRQVSIECFDCQSTASVKSCEGGAFDACAQSAVFGELCLAMCADPSSRVTVRTCTGRVQGSDFREVPDCADWGSTQLFAFCVLKQPGYPCLCDTSDPNAVLMLYPCDLPLAFRAIRSCGS